MKCFQANGDKQIEVYTYLNRRSLVKLICLSSFAMGFLTSACDYSNANPAFKTKTKQGIKMKSEKLNSTIRTRIPPIDAESPADTQTATFALG